MLATMNAGSSSGTSAAAAAKGSSGAVKKLLLASFGSDLEEQMELEARLISQCADSADGREGVGAFLAKRAPEFG